MKYENVNAYPKDTLWYRGNLHSHTVNSDGCFTPPEAAKSYREHGYSFICLSEHDRYTDYSSEFNTDDFIILPGLEASTSLLLSPEQPEAIKTHHIHGILGNEKMQAEASGHFRNMEYLRPVLYYGKWDGAAAAQKLTDTLRGYGCLTTYNHPIWSRVEPHEFTGLKGVWALEIYNYNTVNESGTGTDTTYWDLILRSGRNIFGFASDDNHNQGNFDDSYGGWICVASQSLTHENIINAMLRGEFYSSSGPEISGWGIENDHAYIECSACERINFICGGFINAGTTVISKTENGIKYAEYSLKGNETYVRAECIDNSGRRAWTNAIFLSRC
jgi:hypothetical protein